MVARTPDTTPDTTPHTRTAHTEDDAGAVTVCDGVVRLEGITVSDPAVVEILTRLPTPERTAAVQRMLGIGARAMMETAVGVDLAAIDERVLRTIDQATAAAEERVRIVVADAEAAFRSSLDPDTRTSAMARAIAEIDAVRGSIVDSIDPGRSESHVGVLLRSIAAMLGPGGELEARLTAVLDADGDESGLGMFRRDVERRFSELREMLAHERGRREESESGTRKGFDFEDVVEERLREVARPLGAVVERTSAAVGEVGADLVGDFVVTLPGGRSIAVEAKNSASIGLNGTGGILAELDRAIANRGADAAVCVSARSSFPTEVGRFGVYGNRILTVDDGDGVMLEVAVRWAAALLTTSDRSASSIDIEVVSELVDRIRRMAHLFSAQRRALNDSVTSINKVREGLDEMRRELLGHLDEIGFELERRPSALRAVPTRAAQTGS